MREVTYFKIATGEIIACLLGNDYEVEANLPEGGDYIEGTYPPSKYYIANGNAVERQQMEIIISGNLISGLPIPCTARIEGVPYEVADGELELNANLPGPYRVRLSAVGYLDKEVIIQ